MRKQYHFRQGPQGLLAWDVDRLLVLAAGLDAKEIPLESLGELDEPYWYEIGNAVPTCRSIAEHLCLVQAADLAYPIILCPAGRIMDGMHRVVKALVAGYPTIAAVRFTEMPAADYVGIAPDDLPYDDA
ncbi:hypothetical protein [Castellaniella sp.]|uniref:hypothetical protein n=1 Tax=Castellaniella sp. TaxID=1955812 RepID=UPI002AFFA44F|nr:hypothetical protein [Castellaniella sp.]